MIVNNRLPFPIYTHPDLFTEKELDDYINERGHPNRSKLPPFVGYHQVHVFFNRVESFHRDPLDPVISLIRLKETPANDAWYISSNHKDSLQQMMQSRLTNLIDKPIMYLGRHESIAQDILYLRDIKKVSEDDLELFYNRFTLTKFKDTPLVAPQAILSPSSRTSSEYILRYSYIAKREKLYVFEDNDWIVDENGTEYPTFKLMNHYREIHTRV